MPQRAGAKHARRPTGRSAVARLDELDRVISDAAPDWLGRIIEVETV